MERPGPSLIRPHARCSMQATVTGYRMMQDGTRHRRERRRGRERGQGRKDRDSEVDSGLDAKLRKGDSAHARCCCCCC